jgi:hypothetical protein
MLNIVTALKIEADEIIKKFNLKANGEIYQNNYLNLIITGQGKIKSAINTTLLLHKFPFKTLNFGIAGSNKFEINQGFFINKITDTDSGYDYYPDFFEEPSEGLYTVSNIGKYYSLTDMEGSGFFEAAYKFLSVEKIILYKIVSDTPNTPVNKKEIPLLIKNHLHIIDKLLDTRNSENLFIEEIEEYLKTAQNKMKITQNQIKRLKNLLIYLKIKKKKFPDIPYTKTKKETEEFIKSLTS